MSQQQTARPGGRSQGFQAAQRVPRQGGGPFGMQGGGEKAQTFWPSTKRLVGRLRPEAGAMTFVLLLGVVSVVFSVLGPKILGNATDIIFSGFFSKQFPAGVTKAQIIALGTSLGVDYSMTTSCYDPSDAGEACGECDACQLRLAGFRAAGSTDPIAYARAGNV